MLILDVGPDPYPTPLCAQGCIPAENPGFWRLAGGLGTSYTIWAGLDPKAGGPDVGTGGAGEPSRGTGGIVGASLVRGGAAPRTADSRPLTGPQPGVDRVAGAQSSCQPPESRILGVGG